MCMATDLIASRLDNDFYNFTMGQLAWRYYGDVEVSYRLINRGDFNLTTINLGHLVSEVQRVRALAFQPDELMYLKSLGMFSADYLDFLATEHQLPPVRLVIEDGKLNINYTGRWADAIFWETPLLAMLSSLGMTVKVGQLDAAVGYTRDKNFDRLITKIDLLNANPDVKVMEFGTRRRRNLANHRYVLQMLASWAPKNLLGTSNVHFARMFGIKPLGTMAHQMFMVETALGNNDDVAESTDVVLSLFEMMYEDHPELLTYLPDTYGTDAGLHCFGEERARRWSGVRQDSGNATEIVEKILSWYREHGIDPTEKTVIPSDGLTVAEAVSLYNQFNGQCKMVFGIGTSLTNDCGVDPLNIVIKPETANGMPCVKLSDTPGKVTGDADTARHIQAELTSVLS